jgi:hypothetical protein
MYGVMKLVMQGANMTCFIANISFRFIYLILFVRFHLHPITTCVLFSVVSTAPQLNIEPDLNSLLMKVNVEIDNDTKQIDVLKKRIAKNEALSRALKGSLEVRSPDKPTAYGSKTETVREAISAIQKTRFSQSDVEAAIIKLNPEAPIDRTRLRSVLWVLQEKKDTIKQVRAGNNQQPAEFEKLAAASNGSGDTKEANRLSRGIAAWSGTVTVGDIEAFVKEKNRRMNQIVEHFKVNEAIVTKLMQGSKLYEGEKGWIKIRDGQ